MNKYMKEALEEAKKAYEAGEIPIGAVIVKDNEIVGRGYNLTESKKDPTAHAEINAIRTATKKLGGWRLENCTMYVTVEPCNMCAGAIVLARIPKLVIGAMDSKAGACGSVNNVVKEPRLNHQVEVETGVMEEECRGIIQEFFKKLRNNKLEEK